MTAVKAWPSPRHRITIEFRGVAHVSPETGAARTVIVTVPEPMDRAANVPDARGRRSGGLGAGDAVGWRLFLVWLRDATRFRVFDVPTQDDRPFSPVVEVTRPGAAQAEGQRLENIASQKKKEKVRVVAVDAGHGGDDGGARGPRNVNVLEKNVTLAVAKALVDEPTGPGVKGVLTRNGVISSRPRSLSHGREDEADLFISIHANSPKKRGSGSGTEVWPFR